MSVESVFQRLVFLCESVSVVGRVEGSMNPHHMGDDDVH